MFSSQVHELSESLFGMFDRNKDNALDWQELEAGETLDDRLTSQRC